MKKVITLFGGILLSLIAVLNVHAMTTEDYMPISNLEDYDDKAHTYAFEASKLTPSEALSEIEIETQKRESEVWNQVVSLHEQKTQPSSKLHARETMELREAALQAIADLEAEKAHAEAVRQEEIRAAEERREAEIAAEQQQQEQQAEQYYQSNQSQQTQQAAETQPQTQQTQQVQQPQQQQVQQPQQQQQQTQTQAPQQGGLNWNALAQCESGGNPGIVSANGLYHGLYQFNVETWQSVGGSGLPSQASVAEQTQRAQILYNMRGAQPWPTCGRLLYS